MQYTCNISKSQIISSESQLSSVEDVLSDITGQFMRIPYSATWGSSCKGHFEDHGDSVFLHPYGILSVILCPEVQHIQDLQQLIFSFIGKYPGVNIRSTERHNLSKHSDYSKILRSPGDIGDSCIINTTNENYKIINLMIEQHDNGSMGHAFLPSVKVFIPKSSPFYESGAERYRKIGANWLSMSSEIENYCQRHNFSTPDFSKKELEPFIL